MRRPRSGATGWLGIAVYVVCWDLMAAETLTTAGRRNRRVIGVVGPLVVAHLLGVLPTSLDPFYWVTTIGKLGK